eukprot:3470498-Ditylum_brightwellii.AAC.1
MCLESSGSGADNERSSCGDMLGKQALLIEGSGSSIEFFDDSSDDDMFGIVNTSRMPDPLSFLVANIQAPLRSTSSGSGNGNNTGGAGGRLESNSGGDGDGTGGGSEQNDQSPKSAIDGNQLAIKGAFTTCDFVQAKYIYQGDDPTNVDLIFPFLCDATTQKLQGLQIPDCDGSCKGIMEGIEKCLYLAVGPKQKQATIAFATNMRGALLLWI